MSDRVEEEEDRRAEADNYARMEYNEGYDMRRTPSGLLVVEEIEEDDEFDDDDDDGEWGQYL